MPAMEQPRWPARRQFLSTLVLLGGLVATSRAFGYSFAFPPAPNGVTVPPETGAQRLVRYPQKADLILLTDRPPAATGNTAVLLCH